MILFSYDGLLSNVERVKIIVDLFTINLVIFFYEGSCDGGNILQGNKDSLRPFESMS